MALGQANPLPFCLGPGPSPTQRIHDALKSTVGQGGSGPDDGLRDLWRWTLAGAIARVASTKDLATANAFASTMTVELAAWESLLVLPQAPTDQQRREAIGARITYIADATGPSIAAQLRAIDPNFSVVTVPWPMTFDAVPGKWFRPEGNLPSYGQDGSGPHYSQPWSNFSDWYVEHVVYLLVPPLTQIPPASLAAAQALLNDVLPDHKDFFVGYIDSIGGVAGFVLDQTLLDAGYLTAI